MRHEPAIYRNKRNPNKFLEVVHYPCGHYHVIQVMKWGRIENRVGRNDRFRMRVRFLKELLGDYEKVNA